MAKSKNLSITLPEPMLEEVDRAATQEHRTRSELVREALRYYLGRIPSVEPTEQEVEALERGRAEHRSGGYVTLEQLEYDLAANRRKDGRKKTRKQAVSH